MFTLLLNLIFSISLSAQEALPEKAPVPKDNPMTKEKVELGKQLYFDPRLSTDGTISCNSCHNVMAGGDDQRPLSAGVGGKLGGRSAPTVWNSAFLSVQFWDGRAKSLEEQAKGPLTNPVEMAMENHKVVISRIKQIPGYVEQFKNVFKTKNFNIDHVAKAIATYERTLITPNSKFDKYIKGNKKIFNAQEKRGFNTFKEVGCNSCHNGVNFAGPNLPEGTGFYMKFPTFADAKIEKQYNFQKDKGRFEVTKQDSDKYMFRVPTLRNIAVTAPYFHNGAVKTLDEAVRVMAKLQLNKELTKKQIEDIVVFLNTLTGEFPEQTMPRLPQTKNKSFF
ncbi:MAG: cytochrome-c peroxidase [Bdellovibrionales bacterium]|nr:cytochrome-c peroxidase [Bdellovibrionales bacterium]